MQVFRYLVLTYLLVASPLQATTVKRLDLDGLVSAAHMILVGRVEHSETYWSANQRLILTRHTLEVSETLKGTAPRRVTVTTIGGTIGDRTLYVAGMPVFFPGESAVVFIESSGSYRTVVGLAQGKFSVADGLVSNSTAALEFADRGPSRPTRMEFVKFRDEIRQRLQVGAER